MGRPSGYIPALSFDCLTPLYDPLLRWGMRERDFKRKLGAQADIRKGYRVLDLGCGTGTLTIMLKKAHPHSELVGLDGDLKVLDLARRKADLAGVEITFDLGMAFELPYHNQSFDRVVSSLVVHHLSISDKPRAMQEVLRVLKPSGEFHLADFGLPATAYARLIAPLMRRFEEVADNIDGRLPGMMSAAGFQGVARMAQFHTVFGTLELVRGAKGS